MPNVDKYLDGGRAGGGTIKAGKVRQGGWALGSFNKAAAAARLIRDTVKEAENAREGEGRRRRRHRRAVQLSFYSFCVNLGMQRGAERVAHS